MHGGADGEAGVDDAIAEQGTNFPLKVSIPSLRR